MKKLSELPKCTFTLKHDFNMNGFLIRSKPDEAFSSKRVGNRDFKRTNTTSNIKLNNNMQLVEDDIVRLVEAERKVLIYYELEKRLDAYNYDEMNLLQLVVKF